MSLSVSSDSAPLLCEMKLATSFSAHTSQGPLKSIVLKCKNGSPSFSALLLFIGIAADFLAECLCGPNELVLIQKLCSWSGHQGRMRWEAGRPLSSPGKNHQL